MHPFSSSMMDYLLEFPSVTSTVLCSACGKIPGLIRDLIFNPVLRRANPVKAQKSDRTSLLTVSEQSGCISGYFGKQKCPNPYRFRRFLMVEHRGFPARLGQPCRQPGELGNDTLYHFRPSRGRSLQIPSALCLKHKRATNGCPFVFWWLLAELNRTLLTANSSASSIILNDTGESSFVPENAILISSS